MTTPGAGTPAAGPAGASPAEGIVHIRSPHGVAGTVARLTGAIEAAGAKLFAVIDQSAEATGAGLALRDTTLVLFGSPRGGTPIMAAVPLAALDLPLKLLVWRDDDGAVWISYLDPHWLAERHHIPADLTAPLGAVVALATKAAGT